MYQRAVIWISACLLMLAPCQAAQAHFIWVRLVKDPGGEMHAKAYFSEQPSADSAKLVEKIAGTTASLRTTEGGSQALQMVKTVAANKGELTARVTSHDPSSLEASCDYGVYRLKGESVFLKYYARSLCSTTPADWARLGHASSLTLDMVPELRGDQLMVTVLWQDKPLPQAAAIVIDPAGKTREFVTDAAGQFKFAPESAGTYGLQTSLTEKDKAGQRQGASYSRIGHYATLTLDLPKRGARVEIPAAGESAKELLARARDARVVWKNFPGFRARVVANADDRRAEGRLKVSGDGTVTLQLGDYSDKSWAQRQLSSLVQHRMPDGSLGDDATYVNGADIHPLGRRVRLAEAAMGSEYRIRADVVAQVNRIQGNRRFTISVLDVARNADGKYLPTFFTISFWDKKSNALLGTHVVKHQWVRVGGFDLPQNLLEVESGPDLYKVHSLELSEHQLESVAPATQSARAHGSEIFQFFDSTLAAGGCEAGLRGKRIPQLTAFIEELKMVRNLKRATRAFTLLELVAVLAVLAALATMVIPRLDFMKSQSEHASAAATMGDLASMLQTQKLAGGKYPAFDLLVDGAGDIYSKIWTFPGPGGQPFTATTLSGPTGPTGPFWYQSLLNAGLSTGYTLDADADNASNSGATGTSQDLVNEAAGGTLTVAALNATGAYSSKIIDAMYPDGMPDGVQLIGLGVGSRSIGSGSLLTSAPMDVQQGDDPKDIYSRYIAIFAIYEDGSPAQLKMVVDHRLKMLGERIDQYNQVGPSTAQ